MKWREVILNEICTSQYGYTASAEEQNVGLKFLRITDIVPETINWLSVPYCAIDEEDIKKYKLEKGDIVIARTGNTTGYAKLIRDDVDAVFASYLIRLRVNPLIANPQYIGRLIESKIYKSFVNSIKGGSAQGNANAKMLTLFKFKIPPLPIQQKIADILSKYDDLIENNRRRIELLERSARLLYKEWFVRLRFPGHEHTPIIDGIPEGWERLKLGEVLTLQRGFDLPSAKRTHGQYPIFASTGINGYHEKAKVQAPGIVTGRSGSLGKVMYIAEDFWPLNTTLYVKDFIKVDAVFALHLLENLHLEQYNSGAAVPTLNRNDIHKIKVLCPSCTLKSLFLAFANPIYTQIHFLDRYNQKLKQARDILLPKLMNGEIEV
jgi:type I restriction enzyme S subunit